MKIDRVTYMLMAQDMGRAVAFYRDIIGLELRSQSPMWSELAFRDAIVALHGGGSGEFHTTGLSFQVSDVGAACDEVRSGGGRVVSGPEDRSGEGIRLAELSDPEGNGFALTQYVD